MTWLLRTNDVSVDRLNDGNEQRAEGDGAEGVGEGPAERSEGGRLEAAFFDLLVLVVEPPRIQMRSLGTASDGVARCEVT